MDEVDRFLQDASRRNFLRNALYSNYAWIVGSGLLYLGVYFFYLFFVHVPLAATLQRGYPRFADLQPGPFVDDRFTSWDWWILAVMAAHVLVPLSYLWMLKNVQTSGKRGAHLFLAELFLKLDVALVILLLVVLCYGCNNTSWSVGICRDPRYCEAYGPDYPDRCPPTTTLDPAELSTNGKYVQLVFFAVAFLLLNLFSVAQNGSLAEAVRQYLFMSMY